MNKSQITKSASLSIFHSIAFAMLLSLSTPVLAANTGVCNVGICKLIGNFAPGVITINATTMAGGTFLITYDDGSWSYKNQKFADFGDHNWHPVLGDWNADGYDQIGLYRNNVWLLREGWHEPFSPFNVIILGDEDRGSIPLVGDWNGDGTDSIGVFESGVFSLLMDYDVPSSKHEIDFGSFTSNRGETAMPIAGSFELPNDSIGVVYGTSVQYAKNNLPATYDFRSYSDPGLVQGILPPFGNNSVAPVMVEAEPLAVPDRRGYILGFLYVPGKEPYAAQQCIAEYLCYGYKTEDRPNNDEAVIIPGNAFD